MTGAGSDELFLSLASNCPALNSLLASYSQKGEIKKITETIKIKKQVYNQLKVQKKTLDVKMNDANEKKLDLENEINEINQKSAKLR